MGQGLEVLKTCDGEGAQIRRRRPGNDWDEDESVGCGALEDGVKSVVASANRGTSKISNEVLLNHELLQYARSGNVRGLATALEKGAWTETRRPLVMKPQKPDRTKAQAGGGDNAGASDGGAVPSRGSYDPPPSKEPDPDDDDGKDKEADIGMTALMFSAQNGSVECIRRLLWANAEVNAIEEDGWSALHFASKEGHLEVCGTLLQARADTQLRNCDDKTAVEVAEEDDSSFAVKLQALIKRNGA